MKTWKVAVTFEQPDTGQPQTIREEVQAGTAQSAASIAIRRARKAVPRIRYSSLCLLIEPKKAA